LKLKEPAEAGVTGPEGGTEFAEPMVTAEVELGVPKQPPLLKNAYVTLPVMPVDGNPPVRLAWSVTEAPTIIVDGLIVVVMAGVTFWTIRGSQMLLAGLLFASPEYVAL